MSAPLPCYHCGLPVPSGSRFCASVLGSRRHFCCPGCQAVAEAIVDNGLESYYRHRSESSTNPDALPGLIPDELKLYDRADVQQPFVQTDELSDTRLLIEASLRTLRWLIERHLTRLPGVHSADLNLSTRRLHVQWDADRLPLSELIQSLRKIGYAAHPGNQTLSPSSWPNRTARRYANWALPACCGCRS